MPNALERAHDESFGYLLLTTARLLDERAQSRFNAAAGERLARPALMRLLPFLDQVGIRPTELARRVDVSKQAVGQTLAELAKRGLVEYVDDPSDGRARIVRLTRAGANASRRGLTVLAAIEQDLAVTIGRRRLQAVAKTLVAMRRMLETPRAAS